MGLSGILLLSFSQGIGLDWAEQAPELILSALHKSCPSYFALDPEAEGDEKRSTSTTAFGFWLGADSSTAGFDFWLFEEEELDFLPLFPIFSFIFRT